MAKILSIKRIYDPAGPSDGWRVLTDRLWPRGVSRERAALGLWARELAPSTELRRWYGHEEARFGEFSDRYRLELLRNPRAPEFVRACAEQLETQNVTLLYAARDGRISQAAVLRDWLASELAGAPAPKESKGDC